MIEFESVSKRYPDSTVAVGDFSLRVESEKTTVLVGSSGCGKTTLLRMVNRMVEPSSGRILLHGEDVKAKDPIQLRRSIGYVLQEGGLFPHRKVLDNICTVPLLKGTSKADANRKAFELLETVGLDSSVAARYPSELSGGQQQRVGVARALAADPTVLLMDEPFGAVDPLVRKELQIEVKRLQKQLGITILFVTHDIDEAFTLGDEIVVLTTGGKKLQQGSATEIISAPANDFVKAFIGLESEERQLSQVVVNGKNLVVDENGKPLGVLGS